MGKRIWNEPFMMNLPEKRPLLHDGVAPGVDIGAGTILTDVLGKKWKLGKAVGTGGFGEIYLASDFIHSSVQDDSQYVAKVERHTSGPLFVEVHCYLNIARPEMINEWKDQHNLKHLGIPHYTSSGSHTVNGTKYRFLILPNLESDLDRILEKKQYKFNLKTVLTIARQTIDVLEYMHSKGYIHSDIKASNILLGRNNKNGRRKILYDKDVGVAYQSAMPMRSCRLKKSPVIKRISRRGPTRKGSNLDEIYLVDYGLACRYTSSDGKHKEFCEDVRKAHAGTILFCSRDAHEGVQSRRSDLECLGYNMVYWLTSNLPWSSNLEDHELVYKKKKRCLNNLKYFLEFSFEQFKCPLFLYDYFDYLNKLKFEEEPDYDYCKNLFHDALLEYGYSDNLLLDFDNAESTIRSRKSNVEDLKMKREIAFQILKRSPLKSNLPAKPILRQQLQKHLKQKMNWSKILMDPEIIIKNALKLKKAIDLSDSNALGLLNMDIQQLNPTAAMLSVYNRFMDRHNNGMGASPRDRDEGVDHIEGYTSAMMEVHKTKTERDLSDRQVARSKTRGKPRKIKKSIKRPKILTSPARTRSSKAPTILIDKLVISKQLKLLPQKRPYSLRG